jgi:hypothetical protein
VRQALELIDVYILTTSVENNVGPIRSGVSLRQMSLESNFVVLWLLAGAFRQHIGR